MDAEILQGFIKQTEEFLPLVRGGILVCAREKGGVYGEISAAARQIAAIKNSASILGLERIEAACAAFERELKFAGGGAASSVQKLCDDEARALLDRLAEIEVLAAEIYFGANDFSDVGVADFVEESFGQFEPNRAEEEEKIAVRGSASEEIEEFEIDEEMLEVFALEADELVKNFRRNLEIMESAPTESVEALAELRRSAHTLKGSAGIVGMKTLPHLAHRVEDLLDCIAGENAPDKAGNGKIFELLLTATDCFESLASGETSTQLTKKIRRICESADEIKGELRITNYELRNRSDSTFEIRDKKVEDRKPKTNDQARTAESEKPKSVVRVSLDKLDDLVRVAENLRVNRSLFERRFAEFDLLKAGGGNLELLFEAQCRLIKEMQEKLLRLRTVRFGSLAQRLQRTVRVACEEEEKRAELFISGEDLEIDTQTLDGFVEPLLHLLRNAVAHGVEAPDLRRLLGKPETGKIYLRAALDASCVVVTVTDDGRGISADALREKAVARGFVERRSADAMNDGEAFELIFLDGLTTAETLSQTAGRGVGMNVVKTSIKRAGGSIEIASEARRGTTFTVRLPTNVPQKGADFSSLSVLIVDDSASIRRATAGLIKDAGWQTQTAENGAEALEILHEARRLPDVILTDAEMPQMDGYALLSALKTETNLQTIPVVMITSRAEESYRRRAVALGASDFLTKPCDGGVLLETIKSLFK